MKNNEAIRTALHGFADFEATDAGARVRTQCLYPSFDRVDAFIERTAEGYLVHDGGGAARAAWLLGREHGTVGRLLPREAAKYHIEVLGDRLAAKVPSESWLPSAVLAVANASAAVANGAADHVRSTEHELSKQVGLVLRQVAREGEIARDYSLAGSSGKRHRFDYAVRRAGHTVLVGAVTPSHVSISTAYTAFADVKRADVAVDRFAVYHGELEPGDVSLLQQVASLVPLASLELGTRRALERAEKSPLHS